MSSAVVRKFQSAGGAVESYSSPQLTKLKLTAEQLTRIKASPDRASELAKVYREVSALQS